MALKIEPNRSATAFHVDDGPHLFPYETDAQDAISRHPLEWSADPWSKEQTAASRQARADKHAKDVADAKARGLPVPQPPAPPPAEPTAEELAAIMEHEQAVEAANKRLQAFRKKRDEEKALEDQAAADEVLIKQPPPRPDPNARRPISPAQIRKNAAALTPEEQKEIDDKAAADKAAGDKAAADKAEADRIAAASAHL